MWAGLDIAIVMTVWENAHPVPAVSNRALLCWNTAVLLSSVQQSTAVCEGSQGLSVYPSDKTSEMQMRTEQCGMILTGEKQY
jgi:hypothetical protein